jgi:hypothetical protein
MNKQAFDDAIGEAPPSTIDMDAVITRGRRAARIRRVANPVVAAGIAVVVASGAIAFTMMQGGGESTQVGGQPTSSTEKPTIAPPVRATPPASSPPEGCARPDLESADQVIARLTPVVKDAVQAQQPDLGFVPNTTEGTAGRHGALEFGYYLLNGDGASNPPVCHKHAGFEARATTEGAEGKGNVTVVVQAFYFNPSGFCAEVKDTYCEEVTGPNGEIVVKFTSQQENGVIANQVYVLRPDGTLVFLVSENVATSAESGDAPTSAKPPLDYEQLVAIGTDQRMTLFP